jgi:HD-GYP domain-containing protein (c-di-GMP phosphodiesterase class II)
MEHILSMARTFAGADAGSIYLREGNNLKFSYTQNETLQKRLPEGEKLIYKNFEVPINEKSIAGYVALTGQSLNIEDTETMNPTLPFHFNRTFDEAAGYWTRCMLSIPLKAIRGDILGVLQVINANRDGEQNICFYEEIERTMDIFAGMAAIALERAQMTRQMILRTIKMAEMRDPLETGPHVNRVGGFAIEIYESWARKNRVPSEQINSNRDTLRMAAMLHDVGKVAISDIILKKPGQLTEDERTIMKQHSILGANLFADKNSDFDDVAAEVALNHHERWDGKGYPGYLNREGVKSGTDIPLFGRITAIADVFDALSSRRCYKQPWTEEEVLREMDASKGSCFDPELIEHFFLCLPMLRQIQARYQDEEHAV